MTSGGHHLGLIELEMAPFNQPTPRTLPLNQIYAPLQRYRHLNFPTWWPGTVTILDLIEIKIVPFDPPTPKIPLWNLTQNGSDNTFQRYIAI